MTLPRRVAAAHRRCIMLTDDQLADQLRTQLHREVAAIQPRTDLLASLRRRQARRSLARQMSMVGVPVTAAAVAVSVLVATGGSAGVPPVKLRRRHRCDSARDGERFTLALAHSGRVVIAYRERTNGALQDTGRSGITFAGKNWNAVISQTFPAKQRPARKHADRYQPHRQWAVLPAHRGQERPGGVAPRHQPQRTSQHGHP